MMQYMEKEPFIYHLPCWWIAKDVVDSSHLYEYGAIAERVPNSCQPWSQITEHTGYIFISNRNDKEIDVDIQYDGSNPYQNVEFGTR